MNMTLKQLIPYVLGMATLLTCTAANGQTRTEHAGKAKTQAAHRHDFAVSADYNQAIDSARSAKILKLAEYIKNGVDKNYAPQEILKQEKFTDYWNEHPSSQYYAITAHAEDGIYSVMLRTKSGRGFRDFLEFYTLPYAGAPSELSKSADDFGLDGNVDTGELGLDDGTDITFYADEQGSPGYQTHPRAREYVQQVFDTCIDNMLRIYEQK